MKFDLVEFFLKEAGEREQEMQGQPQVGPPIEPQPNQEKTPEQMSNKSESAFEQIGLTGKTIKNISFERLGAPNSGQIKMDVSGLGPVVVSWNGSRVDLSGGGKVISLSQ